MKLSIFIEKIFKHRTYLGIGSEIPLMHSQFQLTETYEKPSYEKLDQMEQYEGESTAIDIFEIPDYLTVQYKKG